MIEHIIDFSEALTDFSAYAETWPNGVVKSERGGYTFSFQDDEMFFIPLTGINWSATDRDSIKRLMESIVDKNIIYGKNTLQNIVSCEVSGSVTTLFIEKDGVVSEKVLPSRYYILSSGKLDNHWNLLQGNQSFKYIKYYTDKSDFMMDKRRYANNDIWCISDDKEASMVQNGFTYYKGMKVKDVSILSFDLETTGLVHNNDSKVLLISNTYRSQDKIERKLFSIDEYPSQKEMLEDWCKFVREKNPSIIAGHNVYGFDFMYLAFVAERCDAELSLGRDGSNLRFNRYTSKFRKDGSQEYEYTRCFIYGREIVDTMFVAYHFDYARKYDSYNLKAIIKQEGLQVTGRQFYDASSIARNWDVPGEREKIKQYAIHDADDALALFDLMIAAYFYWCQSVPKSFQTVNYSATGSQLNSLLVRSYLQIGRSIPKADELVPFEGAISFGVPGIYKNLMKIDFSALYPNIIRQFKIYDKMKDPNGNFIKITNHFTNERLKNKKLAKDTGDRYYSEVEQSQKIGANSLYGLLGARLNFNYPLGAAEVTKIGRDLLSFSIYWATSKKVDYWKKLFDQKCGNKGDECQTPNE